MSFYDKKRTFGYESSPENDPYEDLGDFLHYMKTPKGVISTHNVFDAIVLAPDVANEEDDSILHYHLYVEDIHRNVNNPLEILNSKKIKNLDDKKAFFKEIVRTQFNDQFSFAYNQSGSKLKQGELVMIRYNIVEGGVPANPIIISSHESLTAADLKSLSFKKDVDIKKLGKALRKKNKKNAFKNKAKDPCEKGSIRSLPEEYRIYFNYDGKIRHFDYKTCKKKIEKTANKFRNFIAGRPSSVWADKNFEAKIRSLLNTAFGGQSYYPYFFGGVREYTNPLWYKVTSNIQGILGAKKGGFEYYQSYADLMTDEGVFKDGAYDCSGIPAWLAFELGFLVGLQNYPVKGINPNYDKKSWAVGRGAHAQAMYSKSFQLELNIDQFAATPGACVFFDRGRSGYGHVAISAGEKPTKRANGDYSVVVCEAMFFQYKTKKRSRLIKKAGNGWTIDGEPVFFGIPISFAMADINGYWDGSKGAPKITNTSPTPPKNLPPPDPGRQVAGGRAIPGIVR